MAFLKEKTTFYRQRPSRVATGIGLLRGVAKDTRPTVFTRFSEPNTCLISGGPRFACRDQD